MLRLPAHQVAADSGQCAVLILIFFSRLLKESKQLEEGKELLNKKIKESEEALKFLEEDKATLERDIKVKKITINIDKNKCLPLRAIFKFDMTTNNIKAGKK